MDHNVKIILCEGKNDEYFLSRILVENHRIYDYSKKDMVIRRIYDRFDRNTFFIIREDGKQRLEKNLRLLISKLRSINYNTGIFVLVDSDNTPTDNYKLRLYNDIRAYISNRKRFPRSPSLNFDNKDPFYGIVKVTYVTNMTIIIHVFVIPHCLEYWIHERRLDTISKLKDINWFTSLCRVLNELGLIRQNLDENLILAE